MGNYRNERVTKVDRAAPQQPAADSQASTGLKMRETAGVLLASPEEDRYFLKPVLPERGRYLTEGYWHWVGHIDPERAIPRLRSSNQQLFRRS